MDFLNPRPQKLSNYLNSVQQGENKANEDLLNYKMPFNDGDANLGAKMLIF